ncbi:MAG: hypothetical protein KF779_16620 [Hyphomonadaceae bacterium]|nr:hypothetical protein [Hyphomonadaceae bacterium]
MYDIARGLHCPPAGTNAPSFPVQTTTLPHFSVAHHVSGVWAHPSIDTWAPGDIVLARATGLGGAAVRALQQLIMPNDAANAVHVGMYDGGGFIYEAVPGRNSLRTPVADWISKPGQLHIRRLRGFTTTASAIQNALQSSGPPTYRAIQPAYIGSIAQRILWRITRSAGATSPAQQPQAIPSEVVCSVFVHAIFGNLIGSPVIKQPIVLPCDFAASADFDCQDVPWCRI